MNIGFVILCYGNYPIVCKCINLLRKLKHIEETSIVIVDNASPDRTGNKIKEKTKNIKNITVLLNDKNSGFAKGNNIGYSYVVNNLGCEIVVVMNSDVFIEDEDFISKLQNEIRNNKDVALIAPDVIGSKGRHTNPFGRKMLALKDAKRELRIKKILWLLMLTHLDFYKKVTKKRREKDNNANVEQVVQDGIVPHGSCIIFCEQWTTKEKDAFYPNTFLYYEEFFLHTYALKKGYKIRYIPSLAVRHIGDASLDNSVSDDRKKRLFTIKYQIQSLNKYVDFMKDLNRNGR